MGRVLSAIGWLVKLVLALGVLAGAVWVALAIVPVGPGQLPGEFASLLPGGAGGGPANSLDQAVVARCDKEVAIPASEDPSHPFANDTLVVGIEREVDTVPGLLNDTRTALRFWERHAEAYAGYPVDYELRPDADDPDVVIRVVQSVGGEHADGVAPRIEASHTQPDQTHVCVEHDARNRSRAIKHELGHTLGLDHSDESQSVMRAVFVDTPTETRE